jgi:hypothetical protein
MFAQHGKYQLELMHSVSFPIYQGEAIRRIMRFHFLERQQTDDMCIGFTSMSLMIRLRKGTQCWTVLPLRMIVCVMTMYVIRLTFNTGSVLQHLDIDRLGRLGGGS